MVAHNAPFDFRFLNYERFRIAGRYFTQPWLDTLVIARRLLRRRLDRFDLGDARRVGRTPRCGRATARFPTPRRRPNCSCVLLDLLAGARPHDAGTCGGVRAGRGARYAHKLALAEDLPHTPGVYVMRDRDGAALYVGKARNIRRRVRSYFGPQGRHSRLVARALEGVAAIDHEETGSELGALLRETALLRELRPPCNSRGGSDDRVGGTSSSPRELPAAARRARRPRRRGRLLRARAIRTPCPTGAGRAARRSIRSRCATRDAPAARRPGSWRTSRRTAVARAARPTWTPTGRPSTRSGAARRRPRRRHGVADDAPGRTGDRPTRGASTRTGARPWRR